MITKLTKLEFENRLKELTKSGEPILMGTPLAILTINNSPKKFYGEVFSNEFRITKNSALFSTPYIIKGVFEESNDVTVLDYKIAPIWFGYLMLRVLPFVGLIVINLLLFGQVKNLSFNSIIIINTFLLLMFLGIPITNSWKRSLEKDFKNHMRIQKI